MLNYILIIGSTVFALLFLTTLIVYIYYMRRAKRIEAKLIDTKIPKRTEYDDFSIKNPYDCEGKYYKAQLHAHTNRSDGKLDPAELIKSYKEKGYNYLAITDHDKITIDKSFDDENFITIPGEEKTIINPFWPLGRHLNRIFVKNKISNNKLKDVDQILGSEGISIINHPATISGLGTQRWDIDFLMGLDNIKFIEISNHFSEEKSNLKYWHLLLNKYGPHKPIWALAVDDAHQKGDLGQNCLMVKTKGVSGQALNQSLEQGCFYGTQGPKAEFFVKDNKIKVDTDREYEVRYINSLNEVVKQEKAQNSFYQVQGNEGFIRIEIIDNNKKQKLWSQPFWLVKNTDGVL